MKTDLPIAVNRCGTLTAERALVSMNKAPMDWAYSSASEASNFTI